MAPTTLIPFITDVNRWKLKVVHGRQTWHYDEPGKDVDAKPSEPQALYEKYFLGSLTPADCSSFPAPKTPYESAMNGFQFFRQLQTPDGHWAGEYGGPMFLLPGLIISLTITGQTVAPHQQHEMIRYLKNKENREGGWGLHMEGPSTMMGTTMNYVALRLLGVSCEEPVCIRARRFIHSNGGAQFTPSWGKFWLAMLNVYEWDGVHPMLPELWLLPFALPFHPGRMWCHCRQIYLPMSYCYARRLKLDYSHSTTLLNSSKKELIVQALRRELYTISFDSINWIKARDDIAHVDAYASHHWLLDVVNAGTNFYEHRMAGQWLREKSLVEVVAQIRHEDLNSNFIGIGPVINMVVMWHVDGATSDSFKLHLFRVEDYLWINQEGMTMQGTNGSQLWDTALAVSALADTDLIHEVEFADTLKRALWFLDDMQIKENVEYEKCYRQVNKGAFPFSTRECGWIVSDCTGEGLKAVVLLQSTVNGMPNPVSDRRIYDCVDVMLGMQNDDGGYASYEKRRGPFVLERLNPSEIFGEIMVDYSYVECSSSVIQALAIFHDHHPEYKSSAISKCIQRAIEFIKKQQDPDGGFFGSWGICYTYATWFAAEALHCIGETYENSDCARKLCDFLMAKQRDDDGGWGESFERYIQHPVKSQVVNTSWALLALLALRYPHLERVEGAVALLMQRQKRNGAWEQESIEGVFNKTCMISYPNYKHIFPISALAKFSKLKASLALQQE